MKPWGKKNDINLGKKQERYQTFGEKKNYINPWEEKERWT